LQIKALGRYYGQEGQSVADSIKSVAQRVSARFKTRVDELAKKKNRTFVGQADQVLDVYEIVTAVFRHDDLDTLRTDLTDAHVKQIQLAAAAMAGKSKA
jgi:hypothetical protein